MQPQSLATFVETSCRGKLQGRFNAVVSSVMVQRCSSSLNMLTAPVGDWWLSLVSGEGEARLSGAKLPPTHSDYGLLTLSLAGHGRTVGPSTFMAGPDEISLSRWSNMNDVSMRGGQFSFLVAHIPLRYFSHPDGESAFDHPLSAISGPGAVLASTFDKLVHMAIERSEQTADLAGMLPGFTDFSIATFLGAKAVASQTPQQPHIDRMCRVMNHLRRNLSNQNLRPNTVARECGLSERQLYREFASRGETFGSALRKLRIEEAAARLRNSDRENVSELAYNCGFVSPTHFARLFRAEYGMSPRDYRIAESAHG